MNCGRFVRRALSFLLFSFFFERCTAQISFVKHVRHHTEKEHVVYTSAIHHQSSCMLIRGK